MNEKRKPVETVPDLGPPESRTRSDIAPKQQLQSGAAPRFDSGFRPAVHIPPPPPSPVDLEAKDLLEDGWDDPDADDSGETLLDMQASVPPELVAKVRAIADPIGELDEPGSDDGEDFPTRETPHALEAALLAVTAPPPEPSAGSTPELPDVTAPMPAAPPPARLDEILAAAPQPTSQPSLPLSMPGVGPAPAPVPPPPRTGFLSMLPSDPPPARLILVAVLSFFGTLVFAAFITWVVVLARH